MYVDLTQDQQQLAAGARAFLAGTCTPEVVRAAWDADGRSESLRWKQLAEVGFLAVAVPPEHGGLGLGDVEVALLLEEAGRVGLPGPLLETSVAAMTIAESGTSEQRERYLPAIAAGDCVATLVLPGQPLVLDADRADLFVFSDARRLHLIEGSETTATRQPTIDGARNVFTVESRLSEGSIMPADPPAVARVRDRAALGTAAMLLGLSTTLLRMSLEHVRERRQFGQPIGSFQAVKHKLAECHLLLETARPALWAAAWLLQAGDPDSATAVSVAKVQAARAARKVNDEALQCHGGIGFAWEHPLHLWLKRGKALEQAYGGPRQHRLRLADGLFAAVPGPHEGADIEITNSGVLQNRSADA